MTGKLEARITKRLQLWGFLVPLRDILLRQVLPLDLLFDGLEHIRSIRAQAAAICEVDRRDIAVVGFSNLTFGTAAHKSAPAV